MIRGVVNDRTEMRILLPVLDVARYEQVIDAVLDTGFDGALALPRADLFVAAAARDGRASPVRRRKGRVDRVP